MYNLQLLSLYVCVYIYTVYPGFFNTKYIGHKDETHFRCARFEWKTLYMCVYLFIENT